MSAKLKVKRGSTNSWNINSKPSSYKVPVQVGDMLNNSDELTIVVTGPTGTSTIVELMTLECQGYDYRIICSGSTGTIVLSNQYGQTIGVSDTGIFNVTLSQCTQMSGSSTVKSVKCSNFSSEDPLFGGGVFGYCYSTVEVDESTKFPITIRPREDNCSGLYVTCKRSTSSSGLEGTIYFKDPDRSPYEFHYEVYGMPSSTTGQMIDTAFCDSSGRIIVCPTVSDNTVYLKFADPTTTTTAPAIVLETYLDEIDKVVITGFEMIPDKETSVVNRLAYHSKRDTTLEPGQPGIEYTDVGKPRLKFGDSTATKDWAELPYAENPSITTTIARNSISDDIISDTIIGNDIISGSTKSKHGLNIKANTNSQGKYTSTDILPYSTNYNVNLGSHNKPFQSLYMLDHLEFIHLSDNSFNLHYTGDALEFQGRESTSIAMTVNDSEVSLCPYTLSSSTTRSLGSTDYPWDHVYTSNITGYKSNNCWSSIEFSDTSTNSAKSATVSIENTIDDGSSWSGMAITRTDNLDASGETGTAVIPTGTSGMSRIGGPSNKWTGIYGNYIYANSIGTVLGTQHVTCITMSGMGGSTTLGNLSIGCGVSGVIEFATSSRSIGAYLDSSTFSPINSYVAALSLGNTANKWGQIYSTYGTIQTSDRSAKSDIKYLSQNEAISIPEGQETNESFVTMADVVDFIKELEPATFCYRDTDGTEVTESDASSEAIQLGLIADDICSSKLFKYIGTEDEIDDILEPEERDETTGEVTKEAVIADEKKTVRGLQPIPLATAALATCKYLLSELEGLTEDIESLRDELNQLKSTH